jgi:hypothetical protein
MSTAVMDPPKSETNSKAATSPDRSTRPGTEDDAGAKPDKIDYPGLRDANGEVILLNQWPADFDPKLHKSLKRTDFKAQDVWHLKKIEELEHRIKRHREEAEDFRRYGDPEERKKAKRLKAVKHQMDELIEQLKASGVNVEELLASMS